MNHPITSLAMFMVVFACSDLLPAQESDLNLEDLQSVYEVEITEKATNPFEDGLSRLNFTYLSRLEKELAAAKTAANLDAALALRTEIQRLDNLEALPDDDSTTAEPVKSLRAIYRLELAKLEAQRLANEASLLPPYLVKLKDLEVRLTKAGDLDDAKAVQTYRMGLTTDVSKTPPLERSSGDAAEGMNSDTPGNSPQNSTLTDANTPGRVESGLRVIEYPRDPSQDNDDEQYYLPLDQLVEPVGRTDTVKSLSPWRWNGERNAVASGFLKIEVDGEYSFTTRSFYDRNMLMVDGKVVCELRDGEGTVATIKLKKGLVPIVVVGYVESRGTTEGVVVRWKPPGQIELSEIPPNALCHSRE